MIRRGPDGPSITWSSPMTDARIVSIRGDLGSRVSTPPLSHGSRPPGNTDPSYRNCRIASCAPQGCRRGDNAQHGESHPGHHRVACVAGDVTGSRRRTGGQMSPTAEAHTPARASGAADGSRDEPGRRRAAGWAGLLLLMAVAAGLLGQGAFYSRVRWYVGVLVALAAVLALVAWPPTRDDARLPPVVAALARRCCCSASLRCCWPAAAWARRTGRSCCSASSGSACWWRWPAGWGLPAGSVPGRGWGTGSGGRRRR